MEKTLILKHISGMLCLLISYSKFTRPSSLFALKETGKGDIIKTIRNFVERWLSTEKNS